MSYFEKLQNFPQFQSEIFYFYFLHLINLAVQSYYYYLLYKSFASFEAIFLEQLVFFTFVLIGLIASSFSLKKYGYLSSFRIYILLLGLNFLLISAFLDKLTSLYLLFAVVRGLASGFFWAPHNLYKLKEVHGSKRGGFINILESYLFIFFAFMPLLLGGIIDITNNYRILFIGVSIFFLLSGLLPFKFNKHPQVEIKFEDIKSIVLKKEAKYLLLALITSGGFKQTLTLIFLILPYYFLQSELKTGLYISLIALFAALIAYHERIAKVSYKIKLGYVAALMYFFINSMFTIFWSLPFLFIRSVVSLVIDSIYIPTLSDIEYRNMEKLASNYTGERNIEMIIINEFFLYIGRLIGFSLVIFIIHQNESNQIFFIRILIAVLSLWQLISLTLNSVLMKKLVR